MPTDDPRPENPALLAAIVAHPDEDTPRLMYADWLDENGDPARAEFIRLHIEWDRRPPYSPPAADLRARLIAAWESAGLNETPNIYERGFISAAPFFSLDDLCESAPLTFARNPIRVVYAAQSEALDGDPGWRDRFNRVLPALTRVTGLGSLSQNDRLLGEWGEEFLHSAHATNLRVLHTGNSASTLHTSRLIAGAKHVTGLLVLDQTDEWETLPECLELIAGAAHLSSLVALRLSELDSPSEGTLGADDLPLLLDSPYLTRLRQLTLSFHDNIDDRALAMLLAWERASQLEVLELAGTSVTAGGWHTLATCPRLKNLRRLVLNGYNVDSDVVGAVLDSPHLRELREFYVGPYPGSADVIKKRARERVAARFGEPALNGPEFPPPPICAEDRICQRYYTADLWTPHRKARPQYGIL
jgi:uncharacterized protein (TIGR02996 family)